MENAQENAYIYYCFVSITVVEESFQMPLKFNNHNKCVSDPASDPHKRISIVFSFVVDKQTSACAACA